MVEIKLHSKKYPGLVALIDDENYELVNKYRWNPYWYKSVQTFYARGHIPGKGASKRPYIRMHRHIMNVQQSEQVDHKDHDGLNNQKSNLRICTSTQNHANMRKHKGVSKFKGVTWDRQRRKWRAAIKLNLKSIHLGAFNNETEAAKAYDKKAFELHGEYALTNF